MPGRVDLNADLGEEVTDDDALLRLVSSANVACGFHAGNRETMRTVCAVAAELGVRVGAQVSYDDREGFGRRPMDVPADLLAEQVREQVSVLDELARAAGTRVTYVKPHGALYSRVAEDDEQARAVLAGSGSLPVLGLPGARILRLAADAGRGVFTEGFPDRAQVETDQGVRLVPRDRPGAVLDDPDEIATRAVDLAAGVDSVCVHGDGPTAVAAARTVRSALEASGFRLQAFT